MVDVHDRLAFEPVTERGEGVRVSYHFGAVVEYAQTSDDELVIKGKASNVAGGAVNSRNLTGLDSHPVGRSTTAREIFEDTMKRYPNIMARLAE